MRECLLPNAEITSICSQECTTGKFRHRFSGTLTKAQHISRLLAETKGKIEVTYTDGHKYFLKMIEEYSRYIEVLPLTSKGLASDQLLQFIRHF